MMRTTPYSKGILSNMQQEPLNPNYRGKKMYLDLVNKSETQNMYPILPLNEGGKDLYFHRQHEEFSNKHGVEY